MFPATRLVMTYHNALWGPVLHLASLIGLRRPTGQQNWLGPEDFDNLLTLAGFEVVCRSEETLLPVRVPGLNAVMNRLIGKLWPLRFLALTQVVVGRPVGPPAGAEQMSCTVLIPTRNERGNIVEAIDRLPPLGTHTEVLFVDGNSTDGTAAEIERVIAATGTPRAPSSPHRAGSGRPSRTVRRRSSGPDRSCGGRGTAAG